MFFWRLPSDSNPRKERGARRNSVSFAEGAIASTAGKQCRLGCAEGAAKIAAQGCESFFQAQKNRITKSRLLSDAVERLVCQGLAKEQDRVRPQGLRAPGMRPGKRMRDIQPHRTHTRQVAPETATEHRMLCRWAVRVGVNIGMRLLAGRTLW